MTTTSVGFALDAATLRHQAIAANIANVNTIGYVPKELSFTSQMEQLQNFLEHGAKSDKSGSVAFGGAEIFLTPMLNVDGTPIKVELDAEVASMAQNSVHFQSLIKGLSHHYTIMGSAVSDGKK